MAEKIRTIGAFEELAEAIGNLLPAEGGWRINEEGKELVIHTTVSKDLRRSSNGGEYDFYTCFKPTGDGVLMYDDTSCELNMWGMGQHVDSFIFPCIIGLEGLRRIAASVGLRTTCEQFLKKQASFAQLREAVEAATPV